MEKKDKMKTKPSSASTTPKYIHHEEEMECYADQFNLAVWYSLLDIINLSLGMFSNLILYIGTKEEFLSKVFRCSGRASLLFNKICVIFFLIAAFIREILHGTGIVIHIHRCSKATYPYEIAVRLLCQYMLYGVWIAFEYFIWLKRGRLFVPRRSLMEPPTTQIDFVKGASTVTDSDDLLTVTSTGMGSPTFNPSSTGEVPPSEVISSDANIMKEMISDNKKKKRST